jgi:hypothetical protein
MSRSPSTTNSIDACLREDRLAIASARAIASETRSFAFCARLRALAIRRRETPPIRAHIANCGAENHDARKVRRDRMGEVAEELEGSHVA